MAALAYVRCLADARRGAGEDVGHGCGRDGSAINRTNMLSHHAHFALSRTQAEQVLNEVASWEDELKAHYGKWLRGTDLHMACDAVSSARMTQ